MTKPVLYTFDISSLLGRVFKVEAPKDVIPTRQDAFFSGEPVFCLKPLRAMVENEIRRVEKMRNEKATHVAIVFDSLVDTIRHDIYPEYKANRPPKPVEWSRQTELAYDMFKSLGFYCIRKDKYEADDLLAVFSKKAKTYNFVNVIFTGDKDILSCVNECVFVYSGGAKKLYGIKEVEEKMGVVPSKVIDLLSMKGDSADNIFGIKGVGETRAIEILKQHSFDQIVEDPNLLKLMGLKGADSISNWILENKEEALLSKTLVSLMDDVELGANLNQMVRQSPNYDAFLNGYMRPTA